MPWAALSGALVWVLKQDLRLERLHWAPVVVQTGAGWEEHDFLFASLDQDIGRADLVTWRADLA